MKQKIAFSLYLFVIAIMVLGGGFYFFLDEFMPYHAEAVGKAWIDLEPGTQLVLLAFLNSSGLLLLINALFMTLLLKFAVIKGEKWAALGISILGSAVLCVPMVAAFIITQKTGANPPWYLILPLILLLWIAFGFFSKQNQNS